jgi:hypothetical protein
MFIGHYGAAFAVKRWKPSISLFTLFVAVQLVDIAWALFVLAGIENVRIVPGITKTNPLDFYYMPYTHGLLASLLWAALAGIAYASWRKHRHPVGLGLAMGTAVFSHWVFDFLVHRPDLPLYDNSAKIGLGLWNFPMLAFGLELTVLVAGMAIYLAGSRARDRRGEVYPWLVGGLMVATQSLMFFGSPPTSIAPVAVTGLFAYGLFAVLAAALDRHRAPIYRSRRATVG